MSNTFLKFILVFVIGVVGAANASASIWLGSFNNKKNGQDAPTGRVEAAIFAAEGLTVPGLTLLYKNDYANSGPSGNVSGLFQSSFSLTGDTASGTVSQVAPTTGFRALYYTVKMNGGKAGFNLYKFSGLTGNSFVKKHYGGGGHGIYYGSDTWDTQGVFTTYGISHLSVWGAVGNDWFSVVPEPGSFLVWMTSMGCVGLIGLRRRRNK